MTEEVSAIYVSFGQVQRNHQGELQNTSNSLPFIECSFRLRDDVLSKLDAHNHLPQVHLPSANGGLTLHNIVHETQLQS